MPSASFFAESVVTPSQQLILRLLGFLMKSGLSSKERKDPLVLTDPITGQCPNGDAQNAKA
jgi:hypothetical protein